MIIMGSSSMVVILAILLASNEFGTVESVFKCSNRPTFACPLDKNCFPFEFCQDTGLCSMFATKATCEGHNTCRWSANLATDPNILSGCISKGCGLFSKGACNVKDTCFWNSGCQDSSFRPSYFASQLPSLTLSLGAAELMQCFSVQGGFSGLCDQACIDNCISGYLSPAPSQTDIDTFLGLISQFQIGLSDLSPCDSTLTSLCENGICLDNPKDKKLGYGCRCNPGYAGPRCQTALTSVSWVRNDKLQCSYLAVPQPKYSFDDAVLACRQIGAELTSILSPEEDEFIAGLFYSGNQKVQARWIGGIQTGIHGEWIDGSDFVYNNLQNPDHKGNCIFQSQDGYDIFWALDSCNKKRPYVCSICDGVKTPPPEPTTAPDTTTTTDVPTTTTTVIPTSTSDFVFPNTTTATRPKTRTKKPAKTTTTA